MEGRLSPMPSRSVSLYTLLCMDLVAIAASGLGMTCLPGSAFLLELCDSIPVSLMVTAHQDEPHARGAVFCWMSAHFRTRSLCFTLEDFSALLLRILKIPKQSVLSELCTATFDHGIWALSARFSQAALWEGSI